MSRQNKVNPGMYTQRGRLTQDDAARELRKQREIGSQHTWQPVKKDQLPRFESKKETSEEGTETSGDSNGEQTLPAADNVQPTKRMVSKARSAPKAKTKTAQPKAATRGAASKTAAKRQPGKAKTGKAKSARVSTARAAKSAAKTRPKAKAAKAKATRLAKRQAVLARNVGGGSPKPRATAKRRKG